MKVKAGAAALNKGALPFAKISALIGGLTTLVIVLVITAEILGRNFLGRSIHGSIEIVEVLLVLVFYSGLPLIELNRGHLSVTFLIERLPPPASTALAGAVSFLTSATVLILGWQAIVQVQFLLETGYHSGVLEIPLWPVTLTSAVFLGLFALAAFGNFLFALGDQLARGSAATLGLLALTVLGMGFIFATMSPATFGEDWMPAELGLLSLAILFGLILLGAHIGTAMALATLVCSSLLIGAEGSLSQIGMVTQSVASHYVWSVAPLFILMGVIVAASGFAKDLYETAFKWLGHYPGGLASATIAACAAFAAVVGESLSGVITMGRIALPEMERYNYDSKLALGAIAVGGSLGILIPPSLGFIIYGLLTEQSIGKLFVAAIIPGILALSSLVLLVTIRCWRNPALGEAGPKYPMGDRMRSLGRTWPILVMFSMVIGGIWVGFFTPTEAGAFGAFMAFAIAFALGRTGVRKLGQNLIEGLCLTNAVFFIFVYATAYTQFLALTQIPMSLADWVGGLGLPRYATLYIIMGVYLALGCLMNVLPLLMLTLPIVFPTIMALGFDPIWFGVLLVLLAEISQLTPPVGMSVFALKAVARSSSLSMIYRGVTPYWLVLLGIVILISIFPGLATFLPEYLMGGG